MLRRDVRTIRDAAIHAGTHIHVIIRNESETVTFNLPTVLTVARIIDVMRANVNNATSITVKVGSA